MHIPKRIGLALVLLMPLFAACTAPRIGRGPPHKTPVVKGVDWGDTAAMWSGGTDEYDWRGIDSDLSAMNAAGITWARVDLYPGRPLTFYSRLVKFARAHRINVLMIVWTHQPPDDRAAGADQAAFQSWLAQVVQHVDFYVHDYEIGVGANISQFWDSDDNTTDDDAAYRAAVHRYVVHLRDCNETIKATDPSATVILGGVAERLAANFFGRLQTEQAYQWFDTTALHIYAATPEAVVSQFQSLKAAIARVPVFAAKPIWITEIGFPCQTEWSGLRSTCSEKTKADYLLQAISGLAQVGITTPIFWYQLHEEQNSGNYGLIDEDKSSLHTRYLPAFNAYKSVDGTVWPDGAAPTEKAQESTSDTSPAASADNTVVIAAGDIADCASREDSATATLVAAYPRATVLMLGDAVYEAGTAAEFSKCYDPTWGQFKSRTYPTVGNHAYETPGAAGYFQYFGAAAGDPHTGYYSYDIGDWHLIVLNGNCDRVGGCGPSSPQDQWLRTDLAADDAQCTLAYWHQPRFSSGATEGSDPVYDTFWRDLYAAGVDLVLNGHSHDYERFAPQDPSGKGDSLLGIREFVVGTGGKDLDQFAEAMRNSQIRNDTTFGVLKLNLHAGSYDWQFLPTGGSSFSDTGHAVCHP